VFENGRNSTVAMYEDMSIAIAEGGIIIEYVSPNTPQFTVEFRIVAWCNSKSKDLPYYYHLFENDRELGTCVEGCRGDRLACRFKEIFRAKEADDRGIGRRKVRHIDVKPMFFQTSLVIRRIIIITNDPKF
jgi:hypothetical protein